MPGLDQIALKLEGIGHALSDNKLAVPPYQRSYAWTDKNVQDLYQDVATAIARNDTEYFLGSIVVTKGEGTRSEVVDGQQRLATTTALIAAIRDYFLKAKETGRAETIEQEYLFTRELKSQEIVSKLQLNEIDNDFFLKRILTRSDAADRKTAKPTRESHERLENAAQLAAKFVKQLSEQTKTPSDFLIQWIDYLRNQVKVIWVQVPDEANAFTIFETLNDRGLDLAVSDILKNYLFHRSEDRLKETQQRWIAMTGILEAAESEAVVVAYIRHLWSARNGLVRERDLYERIKQRITNNRLLWILLLNWK